MHTTHTSMLTLGDGTFSLHNLALDHCNQTQASAWSSCNYGLLRPLHEKRTRTKTHSICAPACTPIDNQSLKNMHSLTHRHTGMCALCCALSTDGASVKDTNEPNETEGKAAPEIDTTVKHLRETEKEHRGLGCGVGGASETKPQKQRKGRKRR